MCKRFVTYVVLAALLAPSGVLAACGLPLTTAGDTLTGSGRMATRDYAIDGFAGIDARNGFNVTVTGGDAFKVAVTADDNVLDAISVRKAGDTLQIGVDSSKAQSVQPTRLEAAITLPELKTVSLDSGSRLTVARPSPRGTTLKLTQKAGSRSDLSAMTVRTADVALDAGSAELARRIRDLIKSKMAVETDRGTFTKLMKAFQEALVHDLDADGFADMYAQTIAYGLLSARIADPHKKTVDDFAGHMRTNPFLRELMETFLKVGGRRGKAGGPGIDFDELGVSEVVQLLDDANMEAVVLDFGDKNPQEDPVIHFYELFLKEYDAKKRMQRGVFYTPRYIVDYIVEQTVGKLLDEISGAAASSRAPSTVIRRRRAAALKCRRVDASRVEFPSRPASRSSFRVRP